MIRPVLLSEAGPSVFSRFWQKVQPEPNSGCWLWGGATANERYGRFYWGQKARSVLAHRASWVLFNGHIPTGKHVLHTCDVTVCVNPEHLWLGCHKDNMQDKIQKGRTRALAGFEAPSHKLTEEQLFDICVLVMRGLPDKTIAEIHGVTPPTIRNIRVGKTWNVFSSSSAKTTTPSG